MKYATTYFDQLVYGHDAEETFHELYNKLLESPIFHYVVKYKDELEISCEYSSPQKLAGITLFKEKANVVFKLEACDDERIYASGFIGTNVKAVCRFNQKYLTFNYSLTPSIHTSFNCLYLFRDYSIE